MWREEFLHGEHCVQFTKNASFICAFINLKIFWHSLMWFVKFSNEPGDYCCRVLRWSTLRKVRDYCTLRFPQEKWLNFYLDVDILLLTLDLRKTSQKKPFLLGIAHGVQLKITLKLSFFLFTQHFLLAREVRFFALSFQMLNEEHAISQNPSQYSSWAS